MHITHGNIRKAEWELVYSTLSVLWIYSRYLCLLKVIWCIYDKCKQLCQQFLDLNASSAYIEHPVTVNVYAIPTGPFCRPRKMSQPGTACGHSNSGRMVGAYLLYAIRVHTPPRSGKWRFLQQYSDASRRVHVYKPYIFTFLLD